MVRCTDSGDEKAAQKRRAAGWAKKARQGGGHAVSDQTSVGW